MTTFKNLTPHEVVVVSGGAVIGRFAPSGTVARVGTERVWSGRVGEFEVWRERAGAVMGVPSPQEGVAFVVSAMVRGAAPERVDLFSPGDLVRDEGGRVVGCAGFVCN